MPIDASALQAAVGLMDGEGNLSEVEETPEVTDEGGVQKETPASTEEEEIPAADLPQPKKAGAKADSEEEGGEETGEVVPKAPLSEGWSRIKSAASKLQSRAKTIADREAAVAAREAALNGTQEDLRAKLAADPLGFLKSEVGYEFKDLADFKLGKPVPKDKQKPTAPAKVLTEEDVARLVAERLEQQNVTQRNVGAYIGELAATVKDKKYALLHEPGIEAELQRFSQSFAVQNKRLLTPVQVCEIMLRAKKIELEKLKQNKAAKQYLGLPADDTDEEIEETPRPKQKQKPKPVDEEEGAEDEIFDRAKSVREAAKRLPKNLLHRNDL